jgi:hypothetical protein
VTIPGDTALTCPDDRPPWLHPLPADPPPLEEALDGVRAAFSGYGPPVDLCHQCYPSEAKLALLAAARAAAAGEAPMPEAFATIYFEHPGCSGGEETIKLFMPWGVEAFLHPPPSAGPWPPEVMETALRAAFWFWPPEEVAALRALAARLFHDWFGAGRYEMGCAADVSAGSEGPGDDVLRFCSSALIDPETLVEALAALGTPEADEALTLVLAGTTPEAPSYCSPDTSTGAETYRDAGRIIADALATREARAALRIVTPGWLEGAFFRHADANPALAADLSSMLHYHGVEAVDAARRAGGDPAPPWPGLPTI